jgi:hypothetical protein
MPIAPRTVKELFLACLAEDPAQRVAWLARECPDDDPLRRQVERMLAAHDSPQSLLDQGVSPEETLTRDAGLHDRMTC